MKYYALALSVLAFALPAKALAQETTTYTYDARGRLITVTRAGGPNNGVAETIAYDPADNRTNVSVTGSSNTPNGSDPGSGAGGPSTGTRRFIVVPVGGFSLIYIN